MARKNLKIEPISANKLAKNANTIGLPVFDDDKQKKKFGPHQFYCTDRGNPSKRAFFFSLFAFIGAAYAIAAVVRERFNTELGIFILGCITAFSVAYHKKGPDGSTGMISSIATTAVNAVKNRIPLK